MARSEGPPGSKARRASLKIKPVTQNHLRQKMIRGLGHAHAKAKIELPLLRKIQINRRNNLLLLLRHRIESRHRPQRPVILHPRGDFLRDVIAHLEIRRENKPLALAWSVKRFVKRRIERQIPAAHRFINDWPQLVRPGVRRKLAALVAEFLGSAYAHRPVPLFWHTHARPDVVSNVIPAEAVLRRGKNIKPGLKP